MLLLDNKNMSPPSKLNLALLQSFDLDEKESLIYKTCLQHGYQTAAEVADNTGIKRPTVYVILDRMKEKGFIKEDASGSANQFGATSPRDVLKLLNHKKQTFQTQIAQWEAYIPELEAIAKKEFQAPRVRFFRGQESMTRVYEEALAQKTWSGIVNTTNVADNFEEYLWKIGETFRSREMRVRDIVVDCAIGREYKRRYEGGSVEIRLLREERSVMTDTIILEDRFFLLSFEEHEMLVLDIESPAITQSQMVMFDALWESLPE